MEKEIELKINKMHCIGCKQTIENNLKTMDGIKDIKVDLNTNTAKITFDEQKITLEKIEKEIHNLNYCTCESEKNCKYKNKENGFVQGIIYGFIPHIGCIGFIIFSILGVSFATNIFKSFLLDPNFFYILILLSLIFASISAAIYLKTNNFLSFSGIKRKWKYLLVLYGSTLTVNLLLFLIVFPYATNFVYAQNQNKIDLQNSASIPQSSPQTNIEKISLEVQIPCSGHAPLISDELSKINGVRKVEFQFPNIFLVEYDNTLTNKDKILSLEVFKTYSAKLLSSSTQQEVSKQQNQYFMPIPNNTLNTQNQRRTYGCGCNIKRT